MIYKVDENGKTDKILLNDILKLSELNNVRIRFNIKFSDYDNPIELLKNNDFDHLLKGQYWNYNVKKSYENNQITLGFVRMKSNKDLWLFFHAGKITEDLNKFNDVGYNYEILNINHKTWFALPRL